MWWGFSPPLDLIECKFENPDSSEDSTIPEDVDVLIVGAGDARHIVKTLASLYNHDKRTNVNFHVIEPTLEQVARSMLLLNSCLEKNTGLQEATRNHLELLGNILLRPAASKYLIRRSRMLAEITTQTRQCSWLSLDNLKHKERDHVEWIFKFWERAACEGIPIVEYWDRKVRNSLGTRYDYKEGAFDWDFHMILKCRDAPNLASHEYTFWRRNGIAFTWLEGEPARCNPTLVSNVIPEGSGFLHFAYMGDVRNGPFFTWGLVSDDDEKKKKFRATDMAEREMMRAIHEIRTRKPMCDEAFAAHRDPSIYGGILVAEMPDCSMEQESWADGDKFRKDLVDVEWTDIPEAKVIFHSISAIESMKNKPKFLNKFDVIWLATNMTKHISNLSPLLKIGGTFLIESRKYMCELRKDDLQKFTEELKETAKESGLRMLREFDSEKHTVAWCTIKTENHEKTTDQA